MIRFTKRISIGFLCLLFFVTSFSSSSMAVTKWPSHISVKAEGAILMDADTGTVLWGKNIHHEYYPASITKVMTALLVIENCDLDETVTFSHDAVFNVEADSSNAGISEGEKLSVRDCLYALLLKSANESANALAEHVAGSRDAFADMMNAKARELGCTNTHFANPSGLNNPNHYTSPYDMALIAKAAFQNPIFEEIDSTTYYKLPPDATCKEGLAIYPGHKMMKKSTPYYYPGIIGGKTGYTTIAHNTLVTCAKKNDTKLITIILKGSTPQYWKDTKNMLDFGFLNFVSLKAADYEKTYHSMNGDLNFNGIPISRPDVLVLDPDSRIILPKTADFADTKPELSYDISKDDPQNAIAKINYRYNDRVVGCTFLEINPAILQKTAKKRTVAENAESSLAANESEATEDADVTQSAGTTEIGEAQASADPLDESEATEAADMEDYREKALEPFQIPLIAWLILGSVGTIITVGSLGSILVYQKHKEQQNYVMRQEQRMKRLRQSGVSADEFNSMLEQKRSSYTSKRKRRDKRRFKFR